MKYSFKLVSMIICIIVAMLLMTVISFADDVPDAPEKVWYKLINHDKVALKWDAVEGANSYILYKLDAKTGKYGKVYETSKTNLTLKKLTADTEYTYAVRAVGNDGRSKRRRVTFRTPEEWYYKYITSEHSLARSHYDGSSKELLSEDFDYEAVKKGLNIDPDAEIYKEDQNFKEYFNDKFIVEDYPIIQKNGYVYYARTAYIGEDIDTYCILKMKNDGSDTALCGQFSDRCTFYVTDDNKLFAVMNGSVYIDGELLLRPDDKAFNDNYMKYAFSSEITCVDTGEVVFSTNSGIIEDFYCSGSHIIFSCRSTYEINNYLSKKHKADSYTRLYIMDTNTYSVEEITEIDTKSNDEHIRIIGVDINKVFFYSYYLSDDKVYNYNFYSAEALKKETLIGIYTSKGSISTLLYKDCVIFADANSGVFRISKKGKIFKISYFEHLSAISDFEAINDFFYIKCYPNFYFSMYYRMKTDGTELVKSKDPLKWK